jgi:hypothetical protein
MTDVVKERARQLQVEAAMAQLGVTDKKAAAKTSVEEKVDNAVIEAIATIEQHFEAVPLRKRREVAQKIREAAVTLQKQEEAQAKGGPVDQMKLTSRRLANYLKRSGNVTESEWANHIAEELERRDEQIPKLQRHFQHMKVGEPLLPKEIKDFLFSLSPDEIAKMVDEDIFSLDKLKDALFAEQFYVEVLNAINFDQKWAFLEAVGHKDKELHAKLQNRGCYGMALLKAIRENDLTKVKMLLNIDSLLMEAIVPPGSAPKGREKSDKFYLRLLEEAVDVANQSKDTQILKFLLSLKEVGEVLKTKKGDSLLESALENTQAVHLLLDNGVRPVSTADAQPVLHLAAENSVCSVETFKLLCSKLKGNEVDVKNKSGATVLGCALGDDNPEKVRILLEKGADPNLAYVYRHGLHGNRKNGTPLEYAIEDIISNKKPWINESPKAAIEIVDLLIEFGANVTPAIRKAAEESGEERVIALVEKRWREQLSERTQI